MTNPVTNPYSDPDVLALAEALQSRCSSEDLVTLAVEARAALGPERGPAALTLARLREKHRNKFPTWRGFVGDRVSFEQASGEAAATWRAARFDGMRVLDLCCGAGGDTVALSCSAEKVIAVDRDADRLEWARLNVARYGNPERVTFLQTDCIAGLRDADGAVLDPDRRSSGTRQFGGRAIRPEDYEPPLDAWNAIRKRVGTLAVKVAPGMPYDAMPAGAVPEFVEDRGELREAVLWFGDHTLATRQAVVLPRRDVLRADESEEQRIDEIGSVLYDPGPAVVRGHLVTHLAARLDAYRIDPEIAYLSANGDPLETSFAASFRVEAVIPWSLRRLQTALDERNVGSVEIRARRFPVRPDALRRMLRLDGDEARTLICTRVGGTPVIAVCRG